MRLSKFPLSTLKEVPADAEIISHQLMLRAGLIRRLASGLYTWMPLGLRVLRKVESIVREEMNKAGALELLMPTVQPIELWQESNRDEQYGPELLRFQDRHQREFCYGPTHEEVITDIARRELKSYKQLPINYYQIQLKFRDEIRPRFGVMRAREFLMKDAYSFHLDTASLQDTYDVMFTAYTNIFSRLGLKFRSVHADSGSIGGNASQEFHVLADSGEDAITFSSDSDYAANLEAATTTQSDNKCPTPQQTLTVIDTQDNHSIEALSKFLEISPQSCIKTLLVKGTNTEAVALLLRGDHALNEIKTEKLPEIASPLTFVDEQSVQKLLGCAPGTIGPKDLNMPIIADYAVTTMSDFVCGANESNKHLQGVNWERDLPIPETADIRNVVEGDPSPDGKGVLEIARGIEVGHIFQLGDIYSKALNAQVLDESGKTSTMQMGCYGIGITRIVGAAIEQNHDENGIKWSQAMSPFEIAIIPLNMHKSQRVRDTAEKIYDELSKLGIEVLLDDRNVRPGIKFADMELIGIPHRITIGEKSLDQGFVEYKNREGSVDDNIKLDELSSFLQSLLN